MKGVIFNLLEEAVSAEYGSDAWIDLMDIAGLDGSYSSLGCYPDAQLLAIVEHAGGMLAMPPAEVLRWFGRRALPLMAERFPASFDGHHSARSFILSANDMIHPEVRKLYAGAACPRFHFHEAEDGRLAMAYQSQRQLCHLAHGFIDGAAAHFGERIEVDHLTCTHLGDPVCRLALEWAA